MPSFRPFPGVRYAAPDGRLDDVLAPPYDVITADERRMLAERSPYNAVHLELPADEGARNRYQVAAGLWQQWRADGVLATDDTPSFYVYRMGYHDAAGQPRQTAGVLGALELTPLDQGEVLAHEHTTPKARADRLDLLRATRANLSPIWALSTGAGLAELCELSSPPDARGTDDDGVHHRLWRVTQPAVLEAIEAAVGSVPAIIADGHHRYETALAYRDERRAAGDAPPGCDEVLAWVVAASEDQLSVAPTHRLVSGLPDGFDLLGALAAYFDVERVDAEPAELPALMDRTRSLGAVSTAGAWLLHPTAATEAASEHALDTSRLDVALASLPPHGLAYQHGVDESVAEVRSGRAQAALLVRPATVAQIVDVGRGAARMPPKTTYFTPKPRTGMVFRSLD
ncbi:MAG TPA: DUF1015 domain-containing protein [Acidimicrobiales bacterium]|nr:DUF1015 domain-containing protein [Acidimicrobiales bacterium]